MASQFSGRPLTFGNMISISLMLVERFVGIEGSLLRFFGVETNEILIP